jgi:hypothetical protein
MLTRLAALALLFAPPLDAQSLPARFPSVPLAITDTTRLQVARNSDEVVVTWNLSDLPVKGLDIYRNTSQNTRGRGRLDYVRPTPATFIDKLPDSGATYWYWLKIALTTGESVTIGPVPTPSGFVWSP